MSIKTKDVKGKIICNIPSYRNDLDRSVDLYEEIARVYGYDNIKSVENFNCSYSTIEKSELPIKTMLNMSTLLIGKLSRL